jgi:hypothetical protein
LAAKIPESVAHVRIEELSLSVRSYNALRARRIRTLGELASLSDTELLKFKNLGRKSLREIRDVTQEVLSEQGVILESEDSVKSKTPHSRNSWFDTLDQRLVSPGGWTVPFHREDALDASVDFLDLSTRSTNVLLRLNLRTLRELLTYPKQMLSKADNMGWKSMSEIETKVTTYLSGENVNSLTQLGAPLPVASAGPSVGIKCFVIQMLSSLPERSRTVLADRYGLWDGIAETLQDIGDKLGLTRERIRQIEAKGLKRIRRVHGHGTIGRFIAGLIRLHLESDEEGSCGVISEEEALTVLATPDTIEEAALAVEFLQDIDSPGDILLRRSLIEVESAVYSVTKKAANSYKEVLRFVELTLQHHEKPLTENALFEEIRIQTGRELTPAEVRIASRVLSISSRVSYLPTGTLALSEWKEFQKLGAPGVAEATLRLLGRPAHFREITLKAATLFGKPRMASAGTIHNALVTNRKTFVWVKPGSYGLAAWGLKRPPFIKDRLVELLSETQYPLPYWHLKKKVLEVCNCKEDSVRMTLDLNASLFKKFDGDQYGLQSHYSQ